MLDLCEKEIKTTKFYGISNEEMIVVRRELKERFEKSERVPGTRASHHYFPISCSQIAHKLTSDDPSFTNIFDFDKDFTERLNFLKDLKVFSYVSCIYGGYWWIGMVTNLNDDEGDATIDFVHPHGPIKSFNWPSRSDKCYVPITNILTIIETPKTTTTGRSYSISDKEYNMIISTFNKHKK